MAWFILIILSFVAGIVLCRTIIGYRSSILLLREKGYRVCIVPDLDTAKIHLRLKSDSDIFPVRTARLIEARLVLLNDGTILALMRQRFSKQIREIDIQVCRQPQHTAYRYVCELLDAGHVVLVPADPLDYVPEEHLLKHLKIRLEFEKKERPNPKEVQFWIVQCDGITPAVRLFCAPGIQKKFMEESPEDPKLNELLNEMGLKPK